LIQQQGVAALSKTAKVERLQENFAIFDFELKLDEMVAIAALAEPGGRLISPPGLTPDWD
jgi:diketogulonate reductase-like aldo/keto reductase